MSAVIMLAVLSTDFANAPRVLVVWRTFELVTSEHPGFTAALHERQPARRGHKWVPARTSMAWGEPAAQSAHEPVFGGPIESIES